MSLNYNKILSIAIPTYKRQGKLKRLLNILVQQVEQDNLYEEVNILVSDNANQEEIATLVSSFSSKKLDIQYFAQSTNLGAEGNIQFLFQNTNTSYIWFMSDDDFPLEGAIRKIVNGLKATQPDVLLFSFMQPPGSPIRQFNYPEPIHLIHDEKEAIGSIIFFPKISMYVMKRVLFTQEQSNLIQNSIGDGWLFVMMSLSVLSVSRKPLVALISEQLASCDEDYTHIWVPTPYLWMYKIALHPFCKKYFPELEEKMRKNGYIQSIKFSWALERGKLTLDDQPGLKKFIKDLKWDISILIKNPKLAIMFLLMKGRIVSFFFPKR